MFVILSFGKTRDRVVSSCKSLNLMLTFPLNCKALVLEHFIHWDGLDVMMPGPQHSLMFPCVEAELYEHIKK